MGWFLHLEETRVIGIVLILLIHKPCWGLSQQSVGSNASQKTVTSGIHHWEIMLCDPGGNGWRRSPHWDAFCSCYLLHFLSFLCSMTCQLRSVYMCSISPPCMWVAVDPCLLSLLCFHQPSQLHDPIYYWNQSVTPPSALPEPSPGPGTPAPTTGVELCMVGSVRRRIRHSLIRDLHNPCSPEHPTWLPCMRADIPHMYTHAKTARLAKRL